MTKDMANGPRRSPQSTELRKTELYLEHQIKSLREKQVFLAMALQGAVALAALGLLGYAIYKETSAMAALAAAVANIAATVGFHAWKCRAQEVTPQEAVAPPPS